MFCRNFIILVVARCVTLDNGMKVGFKTDKVSSRVSSVWQLSVTTLCPRLSLGPLKLQGSVCNTVRSVPVRPLIGYHRANAGSRRARWSRLCMAASKRASASVRVVCGLEPDMRSHFQPIQQGDVYKVQSCSTAPRLRCRSFEASAVHLELSV